MILLKPGRKSATRTTNAGEGNSLMAECLLEAGLAAVLIGDPEPKIAGAAPVPGRRE